MYKRKSDVLRPGTGHGATHGELNLCFSMLRDSVVAVKSGIIGRLRFSYGCPVGSYSELEAPFKDLPSVSAENCHHPCMLSVSFPYYTRVAELNNTRNGIDTIGDADARRLLLTGISQESQLYVRLSTCNAARELLQPGREMLSGVLSAHFGAEKSSAPGRRARISSERLNQTIIAY